MMRYLKILFLSMVVIGLMAGSAFAIKDIQRSGVASTTIATEIIDPSAGYTHNAATSLTFTSEATIAALKKVVITLTNGTFTDINNLAFAGSIAATANLTSTTTDKRRAEFTLTFGAVNTEVITISDSTLSGLTIGIDAGASSVSCTVATDDAAQTNPQKINSAFYKAQQQFGLTSAFTAVVTDTIDVEENLLKLVVNATAGSETTATVAYWAYNIINTTGFLVGSTGPDLAAVSYPNVNVNFTVTGKFDGISSVKIVDVTGTHAAIATLTISSDKTQATGSMKLTALIAAGAAIQFTVDGTTTLEDRKFSFGASLSTADDVKVGTKIFNADSAAESEIASTGLYIAAGKDQLVWVINGLQFIASYVRQDTAVTAVIRVENISSRATKVWFFVNNVGKWKLVKTDDLADGGVLVKSGQALIDAALIVGVTLNGTTGFAVWGVVKGTPSDNKNITVYSSQQMIGVGFRPLPLQVKGAGWYE
jgi:hypothetical protein